LKKKKNVPIEPEIQAEPFPEEVALKQVRCSVCNEPVSPTSKENLCWVCRRLKLSAWRDMDAQMTAQE
jgi:formylmethanofuran dehydrogenase subunit E